MGKLTKEEWLYLQKLSRYLPDWHANGRAIFCCNSLVIHGLAVRVPSKIRSYTITPAGRAALTPEEAHELYKSAAIKNFGEFANTGENKEPS